MAKWQRSFFQPVLPLGEDGRRVTGSKEHIALSRMAAGEGKVLLKNEKNALPIRRGTKVALFGKGTVDYVKGGGGSGDVTVEYIRKQYEGMKNKEVECKEELYDKIKKNKEYIGKFIYFNQGDAAWNSSGYGIRAAGCGPTSMAVCISTLTGKWVTPVDTTSWAYEQGYYSSAGSEHRAIPAMAEHWGLKCDGLGTNYQKIKESLKHG